MAAKKKTRPNVQDTTLRHLWLAGLGVVAVARREALTAANDAASRVDAIRKQAGKLAEEAQVNLLGSLSSVREQGEARASQFSADVEARLAPVLVKLGLKPQSKQATRGRKTAKKAVAKRTRATPARKPAAKRVVRKPSA
ncbi:MAG: hypothetical protein ABWX93_01465 [Pseudoxanthomonas sp.]